MQSSRQASRRSVTRIRGVVAPVVVTVALGASLTGCGGKVTTENHSYQVADRISKLQVRTPGGTVEVVAGTQAAVQVTETIRYNGEKPQVDHTASDGSLSLTAAECAQGITHTVCQVSYRVVVPKDVEVTVRNTGGDVNVTGLAGALDLTGDGGAVRATDLTSAHFTAHADGGSVNAQFAAAPELVDIDSAGGSVTTRLPDGVYAVDASADGGSRQVQVRTDPAAPHKVTVRSDGGSVAILPLG
ncbi:DUF4097 family beta strand repeat-containing protein [Kitasatospora sp. NBC_01266]|uniref:DUF4097 family beta strand repeat-containing protein n=1 Tax=Kitasatospora sp. NBC_01266 TaxID=2903572 RepID=UPI002E36D35E|nr:DUF4097 family beta strand repeat-containing protein [Kitasatospora sp. NBC_01266]